MNRKVLKYTAIVAGVIFVALSFFFVYRLFVFQITRVDPPGGKLPTSQQSIVINFNQTIEGDDIAKNVRVNTASYTVKATSKSIQIQFSQTFNPNQTVIVELNNIRSKTGNTLNKKLQFIAVYVPYNKLTAEERARQTQSSNSFENYELIKKLPVATADYEIRYRAPDKGQKQMVIIVTSLKIPVDDPLADLNSPSMLNAIREARTEAISWLNKNGYNDQQYILEFTEPVLLKEFGGTAVRSEPLEFHKDN